MSNLGFPYQKFELHYFLENSLHSIDAVSRLHAETELLAIVGEISKHFNIDLTIESEALAEGGVRNRWKFTSKEDIAIVLAALTLFLSSVQTYNSFPSESEKKLQELEIKHKELEIKKLEAELNKLGLSEEQSKQSGYKVAELELNNKLRKRRSNMYLSVESADKVTDIGFSILDSNNIPTINEVVIPKQEFGRFILHTDLLPDETNESALIEIVSPVLNSGKAKWKGLYNNESISFNMKDSGFKKDVLLGKHTFQHGTMIEAVLVIEKELDETGEEKVTDRTVTTVLKKIDGDKSLETVQGKQYKYEKKTKSVQQELALNTDD